MPLPTWPDAPRFLAPGRGHEWGCALVALALLVAMSSRVAHPTWGLRFAVMLLVLPLGIATLIRRAAARDGASVAALAALAAAGVSALISSAPSTSFFGSVGWSTGWIHLAGLAGLWALGRTITSDRGRNAVLASVVAGGLVNAAAAILQFAPVTPAFIPQVFGGRPPALLGNAVHLGTACAMALAALAALRLRPLVDLGAAAVLGAAVQLSGGRSAVALAAAAIVVSWRRDRTRVTLLRVGALAVGLLLGSALQAGAPEAGSPGLSATGRVVSFESPAARIGNWKAGLDSFREAPLFGVGPGRFVVASTAHRTAETVRAEDALFYDAHNLVVELLATVGLIGTSAAAIWVLLAIRGRVRRETIAVAAIGLAAAMLQPSFVGTTTVAVLVLGTCRVLDTPDSAPLRPGTWAITTAVLVVMGAVVAAGFVVGERRLAAVAGTDDLARHRDAEALLPPWQDLPLLASRMSHPDGISGQVAEARRAIAVDPAIAAPWARLATLLEERGDVNGTVHAYRSALAVDPWHGRSLRSLARIEAARGRQASADALCRRLHQTVPDARCPS